MTNNELNTIFDEQVKRCEAVLLHKGKEYAPDETDRLSSFKAAAALLHCTQPEALCGMLAKHIVSVYDMCLTGSEHYGMCLLITVKQEDERLSQMKWRDEQ